MAVVWKQETYVDGELKYEPKYLSEGKLARRFAQALFLNQAGENIELKIISCDANYNITAYKLTRQMKDRVVVHIYTMIIEDYKEVI